ncbi:MAG: DUF3592 domain-containing protein [Rhodospirillaceae bacterium]|nr:DUF3592 domain-containing protein [Rhodospirillaceae bacterium]
MPGYESVKRRGLIRSGSDNGEGAMARGRHVGGRVVFRILGRVFLPIGLLGLIAAAVFWFREAQGPRTAQAEGVVMTSGYAVVAFHTPDSVEHRFRSGTRSSFIHVGDRVAVAYDPADPEDAGIDTPFGRWALALIFGVIGAVFVVMGAGMLLVSRMIRPPRLDFQRPG